MKTTVIALDKIKTITLFGIWHGEQCFSFTARSVTHLWLLVTQSLAPIADLESSRQLTK